MTKKQGSRRSQAALANDPNSWLGFVKITLSPDQLNWMKEHFDETPGVFEGCIADLLSAGYKVSFSLDGRTGSYMCTLTGKTADNPNQGYSLGSYAPDVLRALWAGYYKTVYHCENGPWEGHSTFIDIRERWE